ncbi:beta-1,3-galactosyl-O-glycosyl-glycoprotein beta-1,6-N-acetylglucosaminyltransferase 7 [Scyliorhinus canicula]|uniref:beta-1,3-galactosyl-O-glycosyl-glycoprotein beta-1,6-N-acetylglucosaminyltransferase 7 n=1 Tax=Scyliorhinus canicula TaxID=7830 RepID=UPI0018F68C78|nr:beta-1,3-galactosyl-O-glycosyl-glycoprotein beta-1,6-N-acetylglucosaminyltransferase 7 [Scyliorhinus canicula]XP_038658847.1 beta-1,3-galactosyl-O-glycosyl-glycoprotein beta-1,6-N-acetylglucosaminyltransferase 7 [Scyliorhinus canicula]
MTKPGVKEYFVSIVFIGVFTFVAATVLLHYFKDPNVQSNSNNGFPCNFSTYCPAILNGEKEAYQLGDNCQKQWKPETFRLQDLVNCSRIILEHHFITRSLSQEEASYPLAYIITIHKEFEMFVKLLRAIYNPQNVYCIHVDQKSSEDYKRKVKSLVDCFENIFIASKLEHVVYAGFSRLQTDINCMKDLVKSKVDWMHVINLCGQDFPIKTNLEIIQHVKRKWDGKNITPGILQPQNMKYRTQYSYKEEVNNGNGYVYQLNLKKIEPPVELELYFGTAYYALTKKFVKFVLEDTRAKALLEWSRDTYSPDEHYWVTLNRLNDAPGTTPNVTWEGNVRAVKWAPIAGPSPEDCYGYYVHDICVYGLRDLKWITAQPDMFANKFEMSTSPLTVKCMEHWHRNRVLNQTSAIIEPHWYLED